MHRIVPYNAFAQRGFIGRPQFNAAADVADVMAAFDKYHGENIKFADNIAELNATVDNLTTQMAAMKISGVGAPGHAMNASQRAYANAWDSYFRRGKDPEALADLAIKASLSVGSDPDGGWMAPPTIDTTIQNQLISLSPMRGLARVDTISFGGEYNFLINKRGIQSGWVGEEDDRPETGTPKLGAITMSEGELYAEPGATQRLLDDATFDVAQFLQDNVADEFSLQEGAAFVNGDGNGKPMGFLQRPVTTDLDTVRPLGTLQYVPTGDANHFAAASQGDCLMSLLYALRAPYKAGASVAWLMNSNTVGVIRTFKDATGRFLWNDALMGGEPATLLGYPVAIDENMPDIAANAYPIAFGNWRLGYRILDRGGIRVLRDPFTAKPKILFYTTKRVGGQTADTNAIKLLKVAAA